MIKTIYKTAAGSLALCGLLALGSCSDKEDLPVPDSSKAEADFSLAIKGMPAAPAEAGPQTISVFQFSTDNLFSKTILNSYDPSGIDLVKGNTRALYVVSGIEIDATEDTDEAEFALTTVSSADGAATAPLFLSGKVTIEAAQMQCELTMTRGVARIDLDARDADMDITSITVEDAPAATYVFPGEGILQNPGTVSYTYDYVTPPTGIEKGLFMLFESDKDVHVNIHGTVDGVEIDVPAVLTDVARNKVYTLRVYDKNATVKAGFSVADWETETVAGGLDMSKGLLISEEASVIPAGVKVDYLTNTLEIPAEGVKGMTLAFISEVRVDVDDVRFTGARVEVDSVAKKYVRIVAEKPYNTDKGVVTKLNIDIDPQLKGRPCYEINMALRKMNMNTSFDKLTIKVPESPYQIQTVEIGGSTWMAFNAVSPDLSEQIYPEIGKTVEETYMENWVSTVGNFFQFGRQKGYSPWEKNDPNGNQSTPRNIPWEDPACMPLPEGYHVATEREWLSLLPSGVTIPSTYTAGNGELIKAEVVDAGVMTDSPSANANNRKFQMRYIRLESQVTGNVLCIPVTAMKGANWDEYPGGGRAMHAWVTYWISADRYVWLFQIGGTQDALTATQQRDRWNYDGFVPVRGVKNP
ncbi:MAG: hypothetical protein K2F87_04905 [Muribaculaceae bacterium]|nr:hypothetical protein [Muribaculaceae bacterium]